MAITISLPAGPPATAQVRTQGGATTGSICATGTANGGAHGAMVQAWGKVYGPNDTPPAQPPADAVTVQYPSGAANWGFQGGAANELPNAQCGSAGATPQNKVAIWVQYRDGTIELATQLFNGVCATTSDCGG